MLSVYTPMDRPEIDCLDPLLMEQSYKYKDVKFYERINYLADMCTSCKDRVASLLKLGAGATA